MISLKWGHTEKSRSLSSRYGLRILELGSYSSLGGTWRFRFSSEIVEGLRKVFRLSSAFFGLVVLYAGYAEGTLSSTLILNPKPLGLNPEP